jgi:hypothetical protein
MQGFLYRQSSLRVGDEAVAEIHYVKRTCVETNWIPEHSDRPY